MKKILVMIPSGEIYNRDCVRTYEADQIERNAGIYYNVGDQFVYDSSLKLLDFDRIETLEIRSPTLSDIDRYNNEFDYAFLRGSNYFNVEMDWEQAVPVLEKLKIPVIPFGVGAQSADRRMQELSLTTQRVMHLLADHCETIGVRGEYTADVFAHYGIKNTTIIGCPTLFRHNNPNLSVTLPPLESIRNIGFTLRREVSHVYNIDPNHYTQRHRDMILDMARRFHLTLISQAELEEKNMFYKLGENNATARTQLMQYGWLQDADDPLLKLYEDRLFYGDSVEAYETRLRALDLVMGFRLHGNLLALANGVPTIFCSYDARTRELSKALGIPSYDVDKREPFRLEDFYRQDLFDHFNRTYAKQYQALSEFLTRNRMAHRMQQLDESRVMA